ncbi:hypothetical protein M427DRAFT_53388 [Gonapodya prolifera JEL478]|uniref:Uncharacterized protein n=1 Tax=Gonapodya prolifera (strain JEL478) TaxID=1344416 RepID=A0A139AQ74_GONPJ|nr:hypothetical protein M427DRAFT_53388 [Gonapodya prolifera JEL478]|eukprot:KXS18907.1 hypothetical protein M427DRAFT_53388 [Gonapodya prolifera JEL478]
MWKKKALVDTVSRILPPSINKRPVNAIDGNSDSNLRDSGTHDLRNVKSFLKDLRLRFENDMPLSTHPTRAREDGRKIGRHLKFFDLVSRALQSLPTLESASMSQSLIDLCSEVLELHRSAESSDQLLASAVARRFILDIGKLGQKGVEWAEMLFREWCKNFTGTESVGERVYEAMAEVYAKNGMSVESINVLHHLRQRLSVRCIPSKQASSVIRSLCHHHRSNGFAEPNHPSLSAALALYEEVYGEHSAGHTSPLQHEAFTRSEPSLSILNVLLASLVASSHPKSSTVFAHILSLQSSCGILPNVSTASILVSASTNPSDILTTLNTARGWGCLSSDSLGVAAVKQWARVCREGGARVEDLTRFAGWTDREFDRGASVQWGPVVRNTLIQELAKSGSSRAALTIRRSWDMRLKFKVPLSRKTALAVLHGVSDGNSSLSGAECFDVALEVNPTGPMNSEILKALICALGRTGNVDAVLEVWDFARGVRKSEWRHLPKALSEQQMPGSSPTIMEASLTALEQHPELAIHVLRTAPVETPKHRRVRTVSPASILRTATQRKHASVVPTLLASLVGTGHAGEASTDLLVTELRGLAGRLGKEGRMAEQVASVLVKEAKSVHSGEDVDDALDLLEGWVGLIDDTKRGQ